MLLYKPVVLAQKKKIFPCLISNTFITKALIWPNPSCPKTNKQVTPK